MGLGLAHQPPGSIVPHNAARHARELEQEVLLQ